MKYLYYSLHLFYVKIIHLQKFYPPIINITAVMAALIAFLCSSVVYVFERDMDHQYPYYSLIVTLSSYFILNKILYDYYKTREAKLLKEMNRKPLWVKIISALLSVCFIILVIKLWMFDGMTDLYQFIKQRFFHK